MKQRSRHLKIFTAILFVTAVTTIFSPTVESSSRSEAKAPFAIVELYTSEGCSSCPPADKILSNIHQQARQQGVRIFTLSFHVDYWDYLGWKDPFSQREFSQRQRQYAQKLRASNVYTPQMIVNGVHAFGGYRADVAQKHIKQVLDQPAKVEVSLDAKPKETNALKILYRLNGQTSDDVLHIALVERDISTRVRRGENAGRTLLHDNVVHVFHTVKKPTGEGSVELMVPNHVHRDESSIIAYVQNTQDFSISGANYFDLKK